MAPVSISRRWEKRAEFFLDIPRLQLYNKQVLLCPDHGEDRAGTLRKGSRAAKKRQPFLIVTTHFPAGDAARPVENAAG